MKITTEKILKKKNLKSVKAGIKTLKSVVKARYDLDNIPSMEACIDFMKKLIDYMNAHSIMLTAEYRAYEESGKKVNYSAFLKTL